MSLFKNAPKCGYERLDAYKFTKDPNDMTEEEVWYAFSQLSGKRFWADYWIPIKGNEHTYIEPTETFWLDLSKEVEAKHMASLTEEEKEKRKEYQKNYKPTSRHAQFPHEWPIEVVRGFVRDVYVEDMKK